MRDFPSFDSALLGAFRGIPAGQFLMGTSALELGRGVGETQHLVTLSADFFVMATPVTQGQWAAVMGNALAQTGRVFWGEQDRGPCPPSGVGPQHPVYCVSWKEVQVFIEKVSALEQRAYRLPTEAEWEYAARGQEGFRYAGSEDLDAVAWFQGNSMGKSQPVGLKQPNGYGLLDMTGNVWEWVQDWYEDFSEGIWVDPVGPKKGRNRVFRGGAWNTSATNCRLGYRGGQAESYRHPSVGFRLALNRG